MEKGDKVTNCEPISEGFANAFIPCFMLGEIVGLGGCKDFMVRFEFPDHQKVTVALNKEELLPATVH